ncbi:putative adhesin [Yersinia aldovae]|uniref:inverse autotransporter beta-barrel domain-containing protein n=1 Tax=Yersinia aldovae TaxID=29483 RepID=UPI0005EA448E|nr:inverse autotransporter beta-barrel domain-containing protein [Yersinia aldovae]CNH17109.1 putative adhesin [Yersinia aldovae]
MSSIFKGIGRYLGSGFIKKTIAYAQIFLQILLSTLPLYSMSFSTQANSDITKKTVLFKRLYTLTPTDTLESVASNYGLSVDELWALNINLYNNRSAFDAVKYGAVVYIPNQEEEQQATQQASMVASHLSQVGNSLSSEDRVGTFSRLAKGMLLSSTAKTVEEWLGHIGQAQVKLQADDKNDFSGSEVDLFIPLYDQPEKLAFSQFGFRRIDQRNIMNIGLGQRHYVSDWMFGYNIFFDQQISGNAHRRVGFGGELARDYVKLSANSYHRLGGWKNSTRLEDYDERAANGYDIRTEAYLPHYPQLGGKLMYEQYFGNEVALFSINERQKNPSALTAGVSYTPIPLVSLGLDHTIGNGGKNKTGLNLAVNYEINTPWQKQIDPAAVQATRTLAGSRMDLVDRNNNIVLEYRKQQVVTLNLPEKISGKEAQVLPINYTFNARHGLDRIEWDAADVIQAGGQVSSQGNLAYHVALPPYIDGAANAYVLSGRAVDKKGNYSVSSSTNIYVTGVNINSVNSISSLTPPTLPANATSRSILQLALKTDAGKPVSGVAGNITFAVRDVTGNVPRARSFTPVVIGDAQEIQTGVYEAAVTSGSSVGRFEITPTVRGVQLNPLILTQSADATTATIHSSASVSISTPSITTNAADKTKLEVQVTDAFGHPVPGVEVTWVSDLNSPGLEHVTSITNEHGIAENNFSSTVTGTANITVQVGTSTPVQAGAIEIKADNSTMTVKASDFTVTATSVVANGTDKTVYKLKVTDKQGNVVPAAAVEWLSNIGTFIQASPTTTDANGETFIELVSTEAGTAKVTATIGGTRYNASDVAFIADRQSAKITLLPAGKIKAAANDNDWITLTAKIVDAHNNPIKNEEIFWGTASHKVEFNPVSAKTHTNSQGESEIKVASAQVGDASVSAQVVANDLLINQANQTLTFSADATTAGISKFLTPGNQALIANGVATVSYTVLVEDSKGHIVPNSQVLWETDLGEFTSSQTTTTVTTTDSKGEASVALASIKAGFAKVKAAVNGVPITSSAKVEFTADSSTATIAITPVNKQVYVANGGDTVTYNVIVLDKHHNPVRDADITWSTVNNHVVKYSPASSKTDSDGKATVAVTSTAAGSTQVQATLANNATDIADQISFNADRQTAVIKTVVVKGNNQPAPDGSGSVSYVTTVEDINGNPVSGMVLSWGSNINKVTSQTTTTDSNGMSTQTITGTQAGKVEVSVALNEGNNAKNPVKSINEAEFVAVTPVNANSSLLLLPKLIIADDKQNATLKFTLRDANHNPVSGLANQIKVTQSVANYVTVGAIAETTVKGVYEAEIKGTNEGTVDLMATVTGHNVNKTQQLTLQADHSTAKLQSVTRNQTTAKADGKESITYTATVIDALNNKELANVSVGWRTDVGDMVSMTKTNASGVTTATLTSKQAGSTKVTAIVSSNSEITADAVSFIAGDISKDHSTSSLSSADLVADGVTTTKVTVKVNDLNGNPLAGHSDKIKVTADNFPGLTLPTQFIEGPTGVYTASITGIKAGEGKIVTTLAGKELAKHTLKVIADKSSAKIAGVKPLNFGPLIVGNKVTYQATIADVNDNQLGAGIPVHWSVNRDTLMSSTTLTSLTNSAGVAEMEISRDVQGDALVTATVGNDSLMATAVKFSSGGVDISKSSIQFTQGKIIADNVDIATIQVDIRDSKGNPLPNLAGQITTSPKSGEHGLTINIGDNPSGGYLVKITGTEAGNHAVSVFVENNVLKTVNVEMVGDTRTAKLESVKPSSTTFKADNKDNVTYFAKVVDAKNNLLENYPVAWRLAQGEGTYEGLSHTNNLGVAETKLSTRRMGQYKMEARVHQQITVAADVNSTAGDVDPSQSDFTIDVASIDASGNTKAKLTATLKDEFGNLLVGQQVSIREVNNLSDIVITPAIMIDNKNGTYSAEVSATKKGNAKFIASINGIDLNQQLQLLVGNIIPQLSFAKNKHAITYSRNVSDALTLIGLPAGLTSVWGSDNSEVAKVDKDTGKINVLKAGVVTISVLTLPNETYTSGKASYQLTVDKADPGINFAVAKQAITWMDTVSPQNFVLSNSDVTQSELKAIWQSDDNSIATVDSKGQVALVKPGTTKVKVISLENERFKYSEASYELNIAKYKQPITFAKTLLSNQDSDRAIVQQPNEKLSADTHLQKQWSSSDSNIVNVANDGSTATLTGPGKARITLKVVGNDWYEEQSGSYEQEVYVKPKITITKTTATSKHVDAVNGTAWSPVFTDDNFKVELRNEYSEKYQAADRAKVSLLDSNGDKELVGKEINLPGGRGITTVTFEPKPEWVDKNLKIKVVAVNGVGQESQKFGKNEIKVENRFKPHEVWSRAAIYKNYTLHHGNGNQRNTCPIASSIFVAFSYSQVNWQLKLEFDKELLHPITIVKLQADVPRDGDDVTHISSREDIYKNYDKSGNTKLDADCVESNNGDIYTVMTTEYMGKTYNYKTPKYLYWDGSNSSKNKGIDQSDGFIPN